MEVSKTKIKFDSKRKTNIVVSQTLALALKNKGWLKVAKIISSSRRKYSSINLSDIDKNTKEGDTIVIVGKVLGAGELTKRIRICSFGCSKQALDKLKKIKAEVVTIEEEIKKNPKGEGLKILRR